MVDLLDWKQVGFFRLLLLWPGAGSSKNVSPSRLQDPATQSPDVSVCVCVCARRLSELTSVELASQPASQPATDISRLQACYLEGHGPKKRIASC